MTKAPAPLAHYTFDQVVDMLGALTLSSARFDAQLARSETQFAAQLAENAAQSKIADEKLRATLDETAREVKETSREVKEATRLVKSVTKQFGSMTTNLGDVAEEYFYNSLKADPKIGNIRFDSVSPNLRFGNKKQHNEFDIVLVNGKSVALIEVKHKAHVKDLEQVTAQVERYRYWQPAYKDYDIYCGLAAFSVPADVVAAAHERGLFVLQRQGGVFEADAGAMRAL
jgi:type I site-specific restriction endonuclease